MAIITRSQSTKARKIGLALVLRLIGTAVQFLLNLFLARTIGATGIGKFFLFRSWLNLLRTIGSVGLPNYTLRTLAPYDANQNKDLRLQLKDIYRLAGIAVTVLIFFMMIVANQYASRLLNEDGVAYILYLAAVGAALLILLRVSAAALKARKAIELAIFLETTLVPTILLIVAAALYWLNRISDFSIMFYFVIAIGVSLLLALFFLDKISRFISLGSTTPIKKSSGSLLNKKRFKELGNLWGVSLVEAASSTLPFILLPSMVDFEEVGYFGVAFRLVALSTTILLTLASYFSPRFSRLYSSNNVSGLRKAFRESQIYSIGIFLPFALAYFLGGKTILSLYGPEFSNAYLILIVLTVGQLLNSFTGLVGQFLNMTEAYTSNLRVSLSVMIFTIVLLVILGQIVGVVGVAIAVSLGWVLKNASLLLLTRRQLAKLENRNGDNGFS